MNNKGVQIVANDGAVVAKVFVKQRVGINADEHQYEQDSTKVSSCRRLLHVLSLMWQKNGY